MKIPFAMAILMFAVPLASADSRTGFRVLGIIEPSCEMRSNAIVLSGVADGTLAGSLDYSCNAPHTVTLDLGQDLAGASVSIADSVFTVDLSGVIIARLPQGRFSPLAVSVSSDLGIANRIARAYIALS